MKQFISLFIATGFLTIVSVTNSKSAQPTNKPLTIASYDFDSRTCTLLDPEPGLSAPAVPNKGLHLGQNMQPIEDLIIEEKGKSFINLVLTAESGNSIYIVQSREDFMDNFILVLMWKV